MEFGGKNQYKASFSRKLIINKKKRKVIKPIKDKTSLLIYVIAPQSEHKKKGARKTKKL